VDIGVHQDGLVHVSQIADRFVKNPSKVVKVNQRVTVTVLGVDLERKRISLSMRKNSVQSNGKETKSSKRSGDSDKERRPKKSVTTPHNNPFVEALSGRTKKLRGR
jgi:uncharacterized protein